MLWRTKLLRALKEKTGAAELLFSEKDPKVRWYRALKELGGNFNQGLYAYQTDEKGEFAGNIFSGSIDNPTLCSANLCLRLQTEHPIPEKSTLKKVWDEYGSKIVIGVAIAALTTLGGLILKVFLGK